MPPINPRIDLNADLGEGFGSDAELLPLVTSASIACGFHAGDPRTMHETLAAAKSARVAVGAHPGFADRENFGRCELALSPDDVFALVAYQIGAFAALAHAAGLRPQHVKPHGALYNMAARDHAVAEPVVRAIAACDMSLVVFAPAGSALATVAERHGLRVAREYFADRNYLADGSLVPRSRPDALLHDPVAAAARVLRLLRDGVVRTVDGTDLLLKAETVCLHGDTAETIGFAKALRIALTAAGVELAAP